MEEKAQSVNRKVKMIIKNAPKDAKLLDVLSVLEPTGEIIGIKIHKHTMGDSESSYVIVEYESPEDAEQAVSAPIQLHGVSLEKDYARPRDSKSSLKNATFKSKVYVGNLPVDITESDLTQAIQGSGLSPKAISLSKPSEKNTKYAFFEFRDEAERNVALAQLEKARQERKFGPEATVSPAYPSTQGRKAYHRRRSPAISSK